ncbi:gliding motility-associated ABC transporter substrate-binding protein GldG [Galbibacter pacificus]|uniref:Gliding motility-associated ABC transporter substrate-binding protein GldG n=1 Tax=Galbibacter pacificus TaxID=2996052 RepID=A0ABT6FQX5_9FLAO|nr:gliding motility-associated ABC transporter substrate-binding protein GldG [Galbibacter pacificus]MDG3581854.1 gliding motility-associated ABC transporter substrate-binding protein GldG [Galbibacter pacificus]MDG3585672.1 gliding motility-associated ABC transporter substrate-binding protein GldG [Galbibacter pacificus]
MISTKKNSGKIILIILVLLGINFLASFMVLRWDLTKNKRYTLSEASKQTVESVDEAIIIDVLLNGDMPPEFKRLQTETKQLLEEFTAVNNHIRINFVNPMDTGAPKEQTIQSLQELGLTPVTVTIEEGNSMSRELIFPWALVNMGKKTVKVSLLQNKLGTNSEQRINNSVQQLEYTFADAFKQLTIQQKKKIAILKGNNEMPDKYLVDYLISLRNYYQLGQFNLDSLKNQPQKVLENLNRFDAAIIAKPTEAFTDNEKYILDQYVMNGGKTLWLLDAVVADLDSLQNEKFTSFAIPRNLGLDAMLFRYGVRINKSLVQDLISTPVTVTNENGDIPINWFYSPMVAPPNNHPINKSLNVVKLEFASPIDTLPNDIKKTILLKSSPQSKVVGVPTMYSLDEFDTQQHIETFNDGNKALGVLLEGKFVSAFKNRVKPFKLAQNRDADAKENKIIVISDGDIANYNYVNKKPLINGVDKWTKQVYGNKEFLLNSINYLLDDNGLINIRSKEIALAFLNKQKTHEQKTFWKAINIGVPIVLILLFGVVFYYFKRKKYTV